MKVLAFAASNSRSSINKQLVRHAATVLRDDIAPGSEFDLIDLNDYEMPLFSIERETSGGIPQPAQDLFARIGAADALLISFAEHNGGYSAAYKNIFDWMSRINGKVFQGKPSVFMAASPGKMGGASVLRTAIESSGHFGTDLRGTLSVGGFGQTFDTEKGALADAELSGKLRDALNALVTPTERKAA